jgi:mRNA interferase RelE/StbE
LKSSFRSSFVRDLRKIADAAVREQIRLAILAVEDAADLRSVPNSKKLSGREPYFRIRIGDYRIGLLLEEDVVAFVRVLPRKDIYRHFP